MRKLYTILTLNRDTKAILKFFLIRKIWRYIIQPLTIYKLMQLLLTTRRSKCLNHKTVPGHTTRQQITFMATKSIGHRMNKKTLLDQFGSKQIQNCHFLKKSTIRDKLMSYTQINLANVLVTLISILFVFKFRKIEEAYDRDERLFQLTHL